MTLKSLTSALAGFALLLPLAASADKVENVLDLKYSISDSNIVFPESYEIDTQKMMEGWYLKNYTATDDRYRRQGDTNVSDDVIRKRLAELNTVIELPFNQIVRSYIDRYTSKNRAGVSAMLGLSLYYMPIFEQALEEKGLPLELKYLPVIESALNPNAVSKHGAAGLWQFMLATGKGMDMEVSSLVDERRDPYLSSCKAADLLKDLYKTYGDWSLAIAAYNCGPGTLNKAIRRAGGEPSDHDFWSIYNYLPAETRGYVPMFIAANYVMNYYPYHNISPVLATKPLVTDTIMVSDRVHFNQISKVLDIPVDEIRVLNPQFRADIIPGRPDKAYTLVLPSQQISAYIMSQDDILACDAELYAQRLDAEPGAMPAESEVRDLEREAEQEAIALSEDTPLEQPAHEEPAPVRAATPQNGASTVTVSHKVEPGETLSSIASKYEVSTDEIKQWNDLTRNSVRTGQMLRITTTSALAKVNGAKEVAPAKSSQTARREEPVAVKKAEKPADKKPADKKSGKNSKQANSGKKAAAPTTHNVKSGENLTVIAKKYGTTVEALKKANNLSGDNLRPGETLKLPSSKSSTTKASGKSSKSKSSGKKSSNSSKKSSSKKKR